MGCYPIVPIDLMKLKMTFCAADFALDGRYLRTFKILKVILPTVHNITINKSTMDLMFDIGLEFNPANIDKDIDIISVFNRFSLNYKTQKEIFEKIKSYGNITWNYKTKVYSPIDTIFEAIIEIVIKNKIEIGLPVDRWMSDSHGDKYGLRNHILSLIIKYTRKFYILNEDFENQWISIGSDHNIKATFKEIIEIIHNSREAQFAEDAKEEFKKHCEERPNMNNH